MIDQFTEELWQVLHRYYLSFIEILPKLVLAVVLLLIFIFAARQVRRKLIPRLTRNTNDELLTGFLADTGYWLVLILGVSVALGAIGFDGAVTNILAGAGLSAFILGFALKDIGENFLAGILLAFKRPFQIGDLVETQSVKGRIVDMTLRETIIKTTDGKHVFVPNAGILNNPLYNYSVDNFLRLEFNVDLKDQSNFKKAIPLIILTLADTGGILNEGEHKPTADIDQSDTKSTSLKVNFWINSPAVETDSPAIKTQAIQNVLTVLKSSGYSLGTPADEPAEKS